MTGSVVYHRAVSSLPLSSFWYARPLALSLGITVTACLFGCPSGDPSNVNDTDYGTDTSGGTDEDTGMDTDGGGDMGNCEDLGAIPGWSSAAQAALFEFYGEFLAAISGGNSTFVGEGCMALREADSSPPKHSTGEDWPALILDNFIIHGAIISLIHLSTASNNFAPGVNISPVTINSEYPCGDGPHGKTLCVQDIPLPEGDWFMAAVVTGDDVPLADPTRSHQIGFVFDADGNTANNYQASPDYPSDFFIDTDRWYTANYAPGSGWSMSVSQWNGSQATPDVASMARIIIQGNLLVALIPASELGGQSCPPHRMTTFSHLGDYGLNPPHDWAGDIEPPVASGLGTTCD